MGCPALRTSKKLMLRVRPGVLLVRASFAPTSELIRLDFPTLDRPRKAISGTRGAGKCVKSLADSINRARTRIQTVSSVWVAHGKRCRKNSLPECVEKKTDLTHEVVAERIRNPVPKGRSNLAQRFTACVRTDVLAIRWNEELENAAPEGRTNVAQRFSVCVRT